MAENINIYDLHSIADLAEHGDLLKGNVPDIHYLVSVTDLVYRNENGTPHIEQESGQYPAFVELKNHKIKFCIFTDDNDGGLMLSRDIPDVKYLEGNDKDFICVDAYETDRPEELIYHIVTNVTIIKNETPSNGIATMLHSKSGDHKLTLAANNSKEMDILLSSLRFVRDNKTALGISALSAPVDIDKDYSTSYPST